jgi:diaminopimelate epimerase
MCGNGVRCVSKFYVEKILHPALITKHPSRGELSIDTRSGVKKIECHEDGTFSVDMGKSLFKHSDFPAESTEIKGLLFDFVSVGNPHAVTFVEDLDVCNMLTIGPEIENEKSFPRKINVEFVQKISDNYFKVKGWERGCGITLACGTGATAVYAFIRKSKDSVQDITIELPGGRLFFTENSNGNIIMRGPASVVYIGKTII